MNKKSVDVLIIGAGPAGLKCAEVLGGSELNVLVLEKNRIIGPKVCAGGVTGLAPAEALPAKNRVKIFKHHIFVNGKERVISLNLPVSMIDRAMLGAFQLNQVKQFSNVEVQTKSKVVKLTREYAVTKNERIYFQYLIGADGATSIVRRYLGLKNQFYIGMQYIIPEVYDRCCWFFAPGRLRSGYVWIFPHKNYTSAGAYFNPKLVSFVKAKKYLKSILAMCGLDSSKVKLKTAPVNCRYCGIKFKNIFLAGEAAGLVSALTGEGIAYALISGQDVGTHILTPEYNFDNICGLLKYKKRQERALKIFDSQPVLSQNAMSILFVRLLMIKAFRNYFEGW